MVWEGTWRERIRLLGRATRADLNAASFSGRALFALVALLILLHELGMELTLGNTGARVYEVNRNPLMAGLAMGAMSFTVEVILTLGVSICLTRFSTVTALLATKYGTGSAIPDPESSASQIVGVIDTVTFAVALGSPGVILRSFSKDPTRPFRSNMRTGMLAAVALSGANAAIGILAAGGLWLSDRMGQSNFTDWVLSIAKSPLTYLVLFAFGRVLSWADSKRRRQKALSCQVPLASNPSERQEP